MTRGRVLQKFLPDLIRKGRCGGRAGCAEQVSAEQKGKDRVAGGSTRGLGESGGFKHKCFPFSGLCLGPALCNCLG